MGQHSAFSTRHSVVNSYPVNRTSGHPRGTRPRSSYIDPRLRQALRRRGFAQGDNSLVCCGAEWQASESIAYNIN